MQAILNTGITVCIRLSRLVIPIFTHSRPEVTSRELVSISETTNLYIQATAFRSTNLTCQYFAFTRCYFRYYGRLEYDFSHPYPHYFASGILLTLAAVLFARYPFVKSKLYKATKRKWEVKPNYCVTSLNLLSLATVLLARYLTMKSRF